MKLKVVAVSTNRNSFGLRNMVMISDGGQGWQAAANDLNLKSVGTILHVPDEQKVETFFTMQSFEIPSQMPPVPPKLMKEVWG